MMTLRIVESLVDDADGLDGHTEASHRHQSALTLNNADTLFLEEEAQAPVSSIGTVSPQLGPQENLIFGTSSEEGKIQRTFPERPG